MDTEMKEYFVVITLQAPLDGGYKMITYAAEARANDAATRQELYEKMYNKACRIHDMTAPVVIFFSAEPIQLS